MTSFGRAKVHMHFVMKSEEEQANDNEDKDGLL